MSSILFILTGEQSRGIPVPKRDDGKQNFTSRGVCVRAAGKSSEACSTTLRTYREVRPGLTCIDPGSIASLSVL
jgi:hypothetical protein